MSDIGGLEKGNDMNTSEPCAMRRRLCLAAPALLGAGVLAGCGGHPAKAPYSTFSLLDGSTLYSSAFVNKVALVNF